MTISTYQCMTDLPDTSSGNSLVMAVFEFAEEIPSDATISLVRLLATGHYLGAATALRLTSSLRFPWPPESDLAAITFPAGEDDFDVTLTAEDVPVNDVYSVRLGRKTGSGAESIRLDSAVLEVTWAPATPPDEPPSHPERRHKKTSTRSDRSRVRVRTRRAPKLRARVLRG